MTESLTGRVDNVTEEQRKRIENRKELAEALRDIPRSFADILISPIELISDIFGGYIDGVLSAPYSGGQ